MRMRFLGWIVGVCFLVTAPTAAQEDTAEEEEEETQRTETPPALPAPTLDAGDTPFPDEPIPDEEPDGPVILHHIGASDQEDWQEAQDEAGGTDLDVGFEVPGDARTGLGAGGVRADIPDPEEEPQMFSVGAGAGFSRLLLSTPLDFARVEERFMIRIPDFPMLKLGLGAAQMFEVGGNDRYLVGAGVRIGYGASVRLDRSVEFEFVAAVQPGVIFGEFFGTQFDLHADVDLRFVFERVFQLVATGGYSLLATNSLFAVTGNLGIVF